PDHGFLHQVGPDGYVTRPIQFPKRESPKINPESEENFSSPNSEHQRTTIHHASTTNSPSKNHTQPPVFRKIPRKNNKPLRLKIPSAPSAKPPRPQRSS